MLLNFLRGICFLSLSICAWVLTWNLLLMWNISRAIFYTEMVGEWELDPCDIQRLSLWPATRKNDAYGWQIPTTQPWASCPSILCHTEGVSSQEKIQRSVWRGRTWITPHKHYFINWKNVAMRTTRNHVILLCIYYGMNANTWE